MSHSYQLPMVFIFLGEVVVITMNVLKNPFACAFCQESFPNPKSLVTHVKQTHTSMERFEAKD